MQPARPSILGCCCEASPCHSRPDADASILGALKVKLLVDLTDLHVAASRMLNPRSFTASEAFAAGESSIKEGAKPENCHFSIFESESLADAWHRGRTSALAESLGGEAADCSPIASIINSGVPE